VRPIYGPAPTDAERSLAAGRLGRVAACAIALIWWNERSWRKPE